MTSRTGFLGRLPNVALAGLIAVMLQSVACGRTGTSAPSDSTPNSGGAPGLKDAEPASEDASTAAAGNAPHDAGTLDSTTSETCNPVLEAHELVDSFHVETCSPLTFSSNPPSSGNHYPTWAGFGPYTFPLARGFWVHNLEHGAVVVTYNCPDGCEDEVREANEWIAKMLPDPYCAARGGDRRILLIPDPLLDVRWAASAWGVTMRTACFDAELFQGFFNAHVGKGPENICSPGANLRENPPPVNCGQ